MFNFFRSSNKSALAVFAVLISIFTSSVFSQSINVGSLASAPSIDGATDEWSLVTATDIPLQNNKSGGKANITSVSLKVAVHGDSVYFLMQWDDDDMDDQHKPFVWDTSKNKYVAGKQREDRLAIQFAMSGDYAVNWLSGKTFTADTWHWKAARSNKLGLAQDKMTVISKAKIKKAYKGTADDGSTIYISRPSDSGSKFYTTKRYSTKDREIMPKYISTASVSGSVADVQAKGVWSDGKWTLEMSRKLNTGNPDDVVFAAGATVVGGLAIFDHSGDDDHSHSTILKFQF